jgi:DNA replication and repair protein RecF
MFHVEPSFHSDWMNYQRLLKQRNSLLRSRQLATLKQWDQGLIAYGEKIDVARKRIVTELQPFMQTYFAKLLPGMEIELRYRQGWRQDISLELALTESLASDSKQFVTGVGPHRCDLAMSLDNRAVVEVMSRGQLKLLVVAMHLAQMDYLRSKRSKSSIVLIDDLAAELDAQHRKLLLDILNEHEHQVFITTTDRSLLDCTNCTKLKVFHVEHGQIKEVV